MTKNRPVRKDGYGRQGRGPKACKSPRNKAGKRHRVDTTALRKRSPIPIFVRTKLKPRSGPVSVTKPSSVLVGTAEGLNGKAVTLGDGGEFDR